MNKSTFMVVGVVSFLDVLGWKGIWINHSEGKAIDYLSGFISICKSTMQVKFPNKKIEIVCFSDTIVIFTPYDDFQTSVFMHAEICQWALDISPNYNLLLRGVIGYGEYFYSSTDVIMVGPVIDEVSSWNEKADWLGVIFAPSVLFESMVCGLILEDSNFIHKYELIPFKEKINDMNLCVKWGYSRTVLLNLIKNQKYTPPEAIPKYLNTFSFFRDVFINSETNNYEKIEVDLYILRTGATLEFGGSFRDIYSIFVQEISIDFNYVMVTFNLKSSDGNLQPQDAILKIGQSRAFEGFKILVKSIFIGTENSLVEFEVEWFHK